MVEVSRSGVVRSMIFSCNVRQSTARIDRITRKALIYRDFVRAMLSRGTDRTDRGRPPRNVVFCRSFSSRLVMAVGVVGILASFTDGPSSLHVHPSAGALSMHPTSDYIYPYRCVGGSYSQQRTPTRGR